jgi:nucleotide-binding universal stress UspA family protein
MFRIVMVPLDGSELAESALPFALTLAERSGGEMHLVQVVATLRPFASSAGTDPDGTPSLEEARQRSTRYLEEVRARVRESGSPVGIRTHVLSGRPVEALFGWILKEGVDQVVMTTHGRGRFQRFWLGSVAEGLVRSAPAPVLLWRKEGSDPPNLTEQPSLSRILLALDGTESSESMIPRAEEMARLFDATLSLVGVLPALVRFGSPYLPHAAAEEGERGVRRLWLEQRLGRLAEEIRSRGVEVDHEVVVGPPAHEGILEQGSRKGADVVALSTRGRGPGRRLLLGSVADKVIRGSPAHVLVYQARDDAL